MSWRSVNLRLRAWRRSACLFSYRAALSLPLVRYSRLIRSPYRRRLIPRAVSVSSFSRAALDPRAPSSSSVPPHVVIVLTRPARRLVRAGSMAGRYHPLVVVRSLRASKQAGGRGPDVVRSLRFVAGVAGVASSSVPSVSKQATEAMSSSLRLAWASRGGVSSHPRSSSRAS